MSAATAFDAIGNPILEITNDAPTLFPLGTTLVTFSASDAAGNTGVATSTVTVSDQEAPVLRVPGHLHLGTTRAEGAEAVYPRPVVTDNIDSAPTVSCTPSSGSIFPLGTTPVTCTTTDASGNSASASFRVTIVAFEPSLGENLFLDDDEITEKIFTDGFTFPYFGVNYTSIFIDANGDITFGGTSLGSPQISPFFTDLVPQGFSVSGDDQSVFFNQFPGRVVITWNDVCHVEDESCAGGNTIQAILFNDGRIQFAYLGLTFAGSTSF